MHLSYNYRISLFVFKGYSKKYKILFLIISIILLIAILLTGERASSVRAFIGFFIFYYLNKNFCI